MDTMITSTRSALCATSPAKPVTEVLSTTAQIATTSRTEVYNRVNANAWPNTIHTTSLANPAIILVTTVPVLPCTNVKTVTTLSLLGTLMALTPPVTVFQAIQNHLYKMLNAPSAIGLA